MCDWYELEEGMLEETFGIREQYLLEKANSGNVDAMYLLAKLYRDEEQENNELPWLRKAAEAGHAEATYLMGHYEPNKEKALAYYLKAVDMGSAFAMSGLGKMYLQGSSCVEKDEVRAFELFQKAAKLGDSEGYYWLAMCYQYGSGVKKDSEKAFNYAIKAYNALY